MSIIDSLKDEKITTSDQAALLNASLYGVPEYILSHLVADTRGKKGFHCPPELRAIALKIYSPKAYDYVCEKFNLALPHSRVIPSWYYSEDGDPGFTKDAFNALKVKVQESKKIGKEVICELMLDEMSIGKHVEWEGQKVCDFVCIGVGIDDNSLPEAKEVSV